MGLFYFFNFNFFLHPLFFGLLALIFGIASYLEPLNIFCFFIVIILSYLLFKNNKKELFNVLIFIVIGYFLGIFVIQHQINTYKKCIDFYSNGQVSITGTVCDIKKTTHAFNKFTIKLRNCYIDRKKIPYYLVFSLSKLPSIQMDDTIEISNIFLKKNNQNTDYQNYLIKESVAFHCFLKPLQAITLIHRPAYSLSRSIYNFKTNLYTSLQKKLSHQTYSLFAPLFLGLKTDNFQEKEYKNYFLCWGTSHYLARSGLHLIIFNGIWNFLLRLLPLPLILKHIFILLLCNLYYSLTITSISFIRAFASLMVYYLLCIFHAQINMIHILTLITLSILFTNPIQLFFLDFQLSFGITFILFLYQHRTHQ